MEIEILCMDRDRLLMDVMTILAETKTPVNGMRVTVDRKARTSSIYIKMEVKSLDQLDYLRQRILRVRDVMEVRRLVHQKKGNR